MTSSANPEKKSEQLRRPFCGIGRGLRPSSRGGSARKCGGHACAWSHSRGASQSICHHPTHSSAARFITDPRWPDALAPEQLAVLFDLRIKVRELAAYLSPVAWRIFSTALSHLRFDNSPPAPKGNGSPDGLDHSKGPCALKEAIGRPQPARSRKGQDKPVTATLKRVSYEHGRYSCKTKKRLAIHIARFLIRRP